VEVLLLLLLLLMLLILLLLLLLLQTYTSRVTAAANTLHLMASAQCQPLFISSFLVLFFSFRFSTQILPAPVPVFPDPAASNLLLLQHKRLS